MLFSICQLDSRPRFAPRWELVFGLVWMAFLPATAPAQNLLSSEPTGTQYPAQEYYLGLEAYRSGDLDAASNLFEAALRSGRLDVHGRWVDSIPSLAMLAECHWQLGSLPTAREHLDHLFQIAISSQGWLGRVQWQDLSSPGVRGTQPNLWPQAQAVNVLPLKNRIMYRSGQPLTEARLARGGVIEEPSIRSIDVVEIMRGLAVASYRRRMILGQLSENDPLAVALLEATKYPAGLDAPIPKSMIGCIRAAAYFADGDDERSISNASNSATYNGGAHPLTAITLLTQASAVAGSEKVADAIPVLVSTINIAGALQQPELVGEAMQLAAGYAMGRDAAGVVNLAKSVAISLSRRSRSATLHCLIAGADAAVSAGDLNSANEMLGQAQSLASRRDVIMPRLETYAAYVAARIAVAAGTSIGVNDNSPVSQALSRINEFALNNRHRNQPLVSMPRIYQLNLIQQQIGNSLGTKTGDAILTSYCGDSPIDVWRRDPVDAISGLIADRSMLHVARVNIAASQGYGDKFLIAADALLANRFNYGLTMGGRLSQIRCLARTDNASLSAEIIKQRDAAGPMMAELRGSVAAIGQPNQQQIAMQESMASAIALSRVPVPTVMPPPLAQQLPIARLPARTGLLTFVQAGNKMFASFAFDGKVNVWNVASSGRLAGEVGHLLRGIGVGKNRGSRFSEEQTWQTAATALRRHLIPDDEVSLSDQLDHLVIIPDGPLWYVPFELLPVSDDKDSELIGDRITVSYAPTPGLALHSLASTNTSNAIGIASGPLFSPKDPELNQSIVQSIIDTIAEPVVLPATGALPSGLLGSSIGHFAVLAPRSAEPRNQLTMAVSPTDMDSPFGRLDGWMRFPTQVPSSVLLVGLRTPIDGGKMGTGTELFVTMCALKAAGVENVFLSRWAVGGELTAVLLREMLQELPFVGISDAWKRAKMVLRRTELDPTTEPLLTNADRQREDLTGNYPLFWSGYMVSSPLPKPDAAVVAEDKNLEAPAE